MVITASADEYLLTYLSSLSSENDFAVGLILGQVFAGKYYIIHFAKTHFIESGGDSKETVPVKGLKSVNEINENLVADHTRQVIRMLPGGTDVLGIFLISPEDLLGTFHVKLKTVLQKIHKSLDSTKHLFGNEISEKLVVNYNLKTLRCSCKTYDVISHNVQPADLKFLNKALLWKTIECNFDVDYLRYLNKSECELPLQRHLESFLDDLYENLKCAVYFFNGEYKEADESIENTENKKCKGEKQTKSSQDFGKGSKAIKASIYQSMKPFSTQGVIETSGQLRIVGQVACKLWLQPKVTVSEASVAIRKDIMRSLAARLEMHWDSLTEEENAEGINCVHEPPRRVLIELPNNNITLSDYLFPGEGPEDAKTSLEELLDIEIQGKLSIIDMEGQTDISLYDSALESDSEEFLPNKLTKDGNKFFFMGIIIGLIFLVIAVLLQISR